MKEAVDMAEDNTTAYVSLTNDLMFHMVFTRNKEALKGLPSVFAEHFSGSDNPD